MKLQPRLVKAEMWMVCSGEIGSISHKKVDVELWASVGLCIHSYSDELTDKWRISHMESGRSILRHMNSREQAIEYMLKINNWKSVEKLQVDWHMTEEQLKRLHYQEEIKGMLLGLQKEISGERR